MIIVEYEEKYKPLVEEFEYDGIEKSVMEGVDFGLLILAYAKNGRVFIGIEDYKVVGAGGILPEWEGVGYAWIFMNKKVDLKMAYKKFKEEIESAFKVYHRIHTHCLDLPETKRLLEHLGFKKEGIMRRFFKEADTVMYSKLRGE